MLCGNRTQQKNSLNLMGESNPAKKLLAFYGGIPQQGTLAELLWNSVG
jgi:hypothetical protein